MVVNINKTIGHHIGPYPFCVPRAQPFPKVGEGGARAPVPNDSGATAALVFVVYVLCAHGVPVLLIQTGSLLDAGVHWRPDIHYMC